MSVITLRILRNTELPTFYRKLLLGKELNEREKEALLKIAIILINAGNENAQDLGYRIVVLYGNHLSDYEPLYDVAINKGYVPVTKMIENRAELSHFFDEAFFSILLSSLGETYKADGIYLTSQQTELAAYFGENVDRGVVVVAPTSYGKSDLFVNFCNRYEKATIAIIVPTKALLAQMKKRVLHGREKPGNKRKIITHPEMYNQGDTGFVGILTQERLLRMMQDDHDLEFDYVFIDEAHNLLSGDQRNVLLAKVLALLSARNERIAFSYLTPFLVNPENLKTKYTDSDFTEFRISEHLKTERYHIVDLREGGERVLKLYDQYVDEFVSITNRPPRDEIQFLKRYSSSKNIVYLNSPPKLEKFAMSLARRLEPLNNPELLAACEDISQFLHKDYGLLDCIKKGVIYHHGSVPDVVRLYIENLYSSISEIKYVVSSSTLLEGVNIPAEKLFLFECKKGRGHLSASQFKNLVGRICRFRELFDPKTGSLAMLEPEIYIVASQYMAANANIETFIKNRVKVDKKIEDKLENVLLEATPITEKNKGKMDKADEILENLEPGITGNDAGYAKTNFGKFCYANNISEFDILECEEEITELLAEIAEAEHKISDAEELMEVLHVTFINHIPDDTHRHLQRLSEGSAKRFYRMLIEWRMRNASYSEMIGRFLDYWGRIDDPLVYADKWGDTARPGSYREHWVDVSEKSGKQKVNLAIVRIKEEQDFLDNQIIKFVEVLNDLELLDDEFYTRIKYGTTDKHKITMMKNGFSAGLASLLLEKYTDYLTIDAKANTVDLKEAVETAMVDNGENRIHTFEASFYTSE
jgi:hypothetical protein